MLDGGPKQLKPLVQKKVFPQNFAAKIYHIKKASIYITKLLTIDC